MQLESSMFSIIADEVTDKHANKEMLGVILRFVEGNESKEFLLSIFLNCKEPLAYRLLKPF